MLEDRVCLITGAVSGIGYAIAEACRDAGARVMVHGLDAAEAEAACGRLGEGAAWCAGDLRDPETPARLVAACLDRFGRLDGLVNNAARLDRSTIEDFSAAHFDAVMTVNVRAPLLLIQAALPALEAGPGGGTIVNIGSINAHCGAPNLLAYSASKAGLMTATRNLGDALGGRAVRVNQVNVGWTLTESERRLQVSEGRPENWTENLPPEFAPRGTLLAPEEVAAHVVFWLSDRSAPATGQVYEIEQYPVIGRNRISTR